MQALLNCFLAFSEGSQRLARFLYDTVGDRLFGSKQDSFLDTILVDRLKDTMERMPTPHECVQFLWDHTKGVPIRGKYAKYKEYRFQVLEGKKPMTHAEETIKGITKSFHWKSIGKTNHVMARTLPCFCDLCKAKRFDACKNKGYVGSWQPIEVKRK